MKMVLSSQASHALSHRRFVVTKELEDYFTRTTCKHDDYCLVKRLNNSKCLTIPDQKTCQTHKFYDRYGRDYSMLGVGSRL